MPIRLGIVGCGGISHSHGRAALNTPDVEFVACCDVLREKAQDWANRYGARAIYTDYAEMIRKEGLDGVVLATWPTQHREQIEHCLAVGTENILCEKSLTITGQEALEIWQMVLEADAFLMEAFKIRHHPATLKIGELLASGGFGPVDNVRSCFHNYDPETVSADDLGRNWRQRKECGGGVPYDLACYSVNFCNHFIASVPRRVYCHGGVSENYGTVNRMVGMIEYENGCTGIIESSKKAHANEELQVTCADGIIYLPQAVNIGGDITITLRGTRQPELPPSGAVKIPYVDPFEGQLENFAAVIQGQAEPRVPLAESVVNSYTLESLVTSVLEQRPVEVRIPSEVMLALDYTTREHRR